MVFGGGGQVGCHLIEMASATGHDLVGLTHEEVDICDAGAVGDAIARHSPTCIVNAAAYTAVDKAEKDAMRAFAVNREGASVVAEAAAKAKIPVIHLSTDYVFDGSAHVPYQKDDRVNPQGSYTTSKEPANAPCEAPMTGTSFCAPPGSMARSERISSRPCSGLAPSARNFVSSTIRPAVPPRRKISRARS
jgi:dTDP-4-dehydrorhamnose reductase